MSGLVVQFGKFGIVGVVAFAIDYSLLVILTEVFGFVYLASATIAFCVSAFFNYLASMEYVFTRKRGMERRKEITAFFALSVVGLGLNNACMWAGVELVGLSYLLVKVAATAVVAVWNFFSRKLLFEGRGGNGGPRNPSR
ncbi:GtrA family protein [Adlercreutzia aquisgranensis]|uniref:GtrA family protein n=1 Tax=Adlercreutzia aquisgranensis TaxID=2941323 RepID=UPI00203C1196|nr:GtrA family protein [Adlercreutzia aquisgranensis]